MTEPSIKMTRGDGVALGVTVWEGKGKEILCIHGLSANGRCWDIISSSLSMNLRVIAVDLRGRGRSDKPAAGYSIDVHVSDLCALMNDMKLSRPIVMGHSLGAYIALVLAARHPDLVDSIILVDGGGMLNQVQTEQFQNAIKPALDRLTQVFPSFEDYIAPMKMAPFFQPWTQTLENYFRNDVKEVAGGIASLVAAETIIEEALNLQQTDFHEFYPLVKCDTLILRATNGILGPADLLLPDYSVEEMLRSLSSVRCIDIPGANHYSIVFQPNEYRDRVIREFLDGR